MNTPSSISLADARMCVQMSARAYTEATVESELAHALVSPIDACEPIRVALRGSAAVRDWLTDGEIAWKATDFGRVHGGFFRSSDSIFKPVCELVQSSPGHAVMVMGHSKGGGEAPFVALRLARLGVPILAVHTFGGPRVGDAAWRSAYNSQTNNIRSATTYGQKLGDVTFRWVHEEDIVPRMPPWISGYRHVGHECFLSAFGGVELDPPIWRLAASDLWGTFWGYKAGCVEQVMDHPVSRYQEHLNQL